MKPRAVAAHSSEHTGRHGAAFFTCLVFLVPAAALLAACAAPQTREVLQARESFAPRARLAVPFHPQTEFQCGPAALAGVLQFSGIAAQPAALSEDVFLPARAGSLQAEIAAAIRQRDRLAYPLHAGDTPPLHNLLRALEAGYPALVLQDLGAGPWSRWHYAVAVGYDLGEQEIVLNSGTRAGQRMSLAAFESTWRRAGYWALLACPPESVPPFAAEEVWNGAAFDLEQTGRGEAALRAYVAAGERWPGSDTALMGAGNSAYALGRYAAAARNFHALAARNGTHAAGAWNNLAYALRELGCPRAAREAAARALALAPGEPAIRRTLGDMDAAPQAEPTAGDSDRCEYWRARVSPPGHTGAHAPAGREPGRVVRNPSHYRRPGA